MQFGRKRFGLICSYVMFIRLFIAKNTFVWYNILVLINGSLDNTVILYDCINRNVCITETDGLSIKNLTFKSSISWVLLKETYANLIFLETLWPEESNGILLNAIQALYKTLEAANLHVFNKFFSTNTTLLFHR